MNPHLIPPTITIIHNPVQNLTIVDATTNMTIAQNDILTPRSEIGLIISVEIMTTRQRTIVRILVG